MTPPSFLPHALLNGALVATDEARVSPLGDGFMFGHGLFETIKIRRGQPRFFGDHNARLARSAEMLGLGGIFSRAELRSHCHGVIAANQLVDGSIKVVLFQDKETTGELILARRGLYPEELYTRGFRLQLRVGQARSGTQYAHKTLNYLHNLTAKREALAAGFDEALFVDENENLLEGATSNVFVVLGRQVVTPPTDGRILPGVARGRVLRLLGKRAAEVPVSLGRLEEATEVFVTNALLDVMPVSRIGERSFDLAKNPVTRLLQARYTSSVD